jgi:hypothetical protein
MLLFDWGQPERFKRMNLKEAMKAAKITGKKTKVTEKSEVSIKVNLNKKRSCKKSAAISNSN